VGIAVLAFILLINLITLLQFGLQSSRNFAPVAISSAGPVGMFLALVFLCEFWRVPDFRVLILLYFAAWSATLGYLLATVKPTSAANVGDSTWKLGKDHIALGWPVLLAGNGLVLVQSVDRLVVSWEASIQGFAMYSLAASATVTIALALIVAAFRVFFPHLAALERQQHREVYATASRLLFLCWALILPYYFVLEAFVKRALPQYSGSLPVACILLGGTVFLGEIQFLHASFAYVYGRQRTFLWYTLAALVLTFLIAVGAAFGTHSLRIVAAGEVVALGLWWMFDEWQLRELTGQTPKEWLALLGLFCWALVSYWVALHQFHSGPARMAVYYGMVAGALWLVCSAELRLILKFLTFARSRVLQAV
jgi:O-antigen/teichoic acid export membrane protein